MLDQSHLRVQIPNSVRISTIQQNYQNLVDYLTAVRESDNFELVAYAHWHLFQIVEHALKPIMRKDKRLIKVVPDFPTLVFAEVNLDTPQKVKEALRTLYKKMNAFWNFKRKVVHRVIRDFFFDMARQDAEVARWVKLFAIWYKNKYRKTFVGAEEIIYMRPLHYSKVILQEKNKGVL